MKKNWIIRVLARISWVLMGKERRTQIEREVFHETLVKLSSAGMVEQLRIMDPVSKTLLTEEFIQKLPGEHIAVATAVMNFTSVFHDTKYTTPEALFSRFLSQYACDDDCLAAIVLFFASVKYIAQQHGIVYTPDYTPQDNQAAARVLFNVLAGKLSSVRRDLWPSPDLLAEEFMALEA